MSIRLRDVLMERLGELRYEPTEKRIRATLDATTVVDSRRAMLVWEPKRIVPSYAVPVEDINGELVAGPLADGSPGPSADGSPGPSADGSPGPLADGSPGPLADGSPGRPPGAPPVTGRRLGAHRVYDPSVPFAVHTVDGEPMMVRVNGGDREAAAFHPQDPGLAGYLILDFGAFDAWYEEDERNLAHPRDPFHRIDILHGSRHVSVSWNGEVLAESDRPDLLFEPPLPVRYYLPIEDVRTDVLQPSRTRTFCAYKGEASYWSLRDEADLAWTYQQPLREAAEITGRIAFFNERLDIVVDGQPLPRPVTPWSRE